MSFLRDPAQLLRLYYLASNLLTFLSWLLLHQAFQSVLKTSSITLRHRLKITLESILRGWFDGLSRVTLAMNDRLHTEEHPHGLVGATADGKILCGHLDLSIKLRYIWLAYPVILIFSTSYFLSSVLVRNLAVHIWREPLLQW